MKVGVVRRSNEVKLDHLGKAACQEVQETDGFVLEGGERLEHECPICLQQ